MSVGRKLKKYLECNGIKNGWFAERLGMRLVQLSQVICGHAKIPKKYWYKIITLTHGEITVADMLEEVLQEYEFLEVKKDVWPSECRVSLKKLDNTEIE